MWEMNRKDNCANFYSEQIVQISARFNRYGKPFGFGTRWGLQMYPWGMSLPEPCAPLRYVTGRSFNFFFLNSFIISLIPSQIIESTIWYESCKRRIILKAKYQIKYCHQDHQIKYICSRKVPLPTNSSKQGYVHALMHEKQKNTLREQTRMLL